MAGLSKAEAVPNAFYISTTTSILERRPRTLKHGDTFAVFDHYGDVSSRGGSPEGLFHKDTRFLSDLRLRGQRAAAAAAQLDRAGQQHAADGGPDQPRSFHRRRTRARARHDPDRPLKVSLGRRVLRAARRAQFRRGGARLRVCVPFRGGFRRYLRASRPSSGAPGKDRDQDWRERRRLPVPRSRRRGSPLDRPVRSSARRDGREHRPLSPRARPGRSQLRVHDDLVRGARAQAEAGPPVFHRLARRPPGLARVDGSRRFDRDVERTVQRSAVPVGRRPLHADDRRRRTARSRTAAFPGSRPPSVATRSSPRSRCCGSIRRSPRAF